MKTHHKDIHYYVDRLKSWDCFSIAGYSDAEWFCMMEHRIGKRTGLGQILDAKHGKLLLDVLKRRQNDPRFLVAIPKVLWRLPPFSSRTLEYLPEEILRRNGIEIECYERDMVTDDLARDGGLYPFIAQLRKMNTIIIGHEALRGLDFLDFNCFIAVSSPNLHLEEDGIDRAVRSAQQYKAEGVYLVSAGVSAAIIIDKLHDTIPNSFFIDCASIWDAFVGIGGQRQWRAKLYSDKRLLSKWRRKNIHGDYIDEAHKPRDRTG